MLGTSFLLPNYLQVALLCESMIAGFMLLRTSCALVFSLIRARKYSWDNIIQVIHMEFAGGEINASHSGALQDFEIRDAICDVMEGGREAFESRYYRITKALE